MFRNGTSGDQHGWPAEVVSLVRIDMAGADGIPSGDMALHITADIVDAIARRVLELQRQAEVKAEGVERELLTAGELAARLGVHRKWVYAHQRQLGAIRLGVGPKARLRFPATAVAFGLKPRREGRAFPSGLTEDQPEPRRRQRRRLPSRPAPLIDSGPTAA